MEQLIDFHAPEVQAVLDTLLKDRSTGKNIIWATDPPDELQTVMYEPVTDRSQITTQQLGLTHYEVVLPRMMKQTDTQQQRTRKKGEVFSPAWVCNKMNNALDADWFRGLGTEQTTGQFTVELPQGWQTVETPVQFPACKGRIPAWVQYVQSRRLEVTCGEAPFLASRYDAATGEMIPVTRRIGILDRKLRVVSENAATEDEWRKYATNAVQSTYGYEYQGDNLLLARVNLLLTYAEHLQARWQRKPTKEELQPIATIITWNLWQMDGLHLSVPGGKPQPETEQLDLFSMFGAAEPQPPTVSCKVKNWRKGSHGTAQNFETIQEGSTSMKFDYVIGNPPYQEVDGGSGASATPVYNKFIEETKTLNPTAMSFIIPAKWYSGGKGLDKFREQMLNDKRMAVLVDYLELTDVDPDQQESKTYNLWVAGTQVTKSNQSNVLEDGGSVKFDPTTNTLTLNDADLTLDGDAGGYCCIDSQLAEELTITGTATLSNADGILTEGPLTLKDATLTFTGNIDGDIGEDAIRAGSSDEDITIENSKVTIAGTNAEGNFFQFGIRCGKLTVANSTLNVKAGGSAIVANELEASGAGTVITAETDALEDQEYYALKLGRLIMSHGLVLVEGEVNKSKKAKIAQPEQAPTDFKVYWVVRPGDEPVNGGVQFPGAIFGSEEEERLFEGWFLEDGTRLEDSRYYMGSGAKYVGNLDRDVTFYGHWRTAESGEGSPDGGDGFGTLLAVGAVVGVAGVVAYQVGTELILDQLLPAGVAVPHTRAELAMLLWNTAGRPAPATLPAFADVADPELAQAAQWAIEQGYLKARADGSFKPDKGVAKWRVIRGYRAVTEP